MLFWFYECLLLILVFSYKAIVAAPKWNSIIPRWSRNFEINLTFSRRLREGGVSERIYREKYNIWSFYFCFFLPRTIFPIQRFCAKHSEEGMLVARWLQPQVCRLILRYILLIHRRLAKYKDGSCVKLLLRCYFTSCQMLKKMLIVALFILLYSRVTVLE